MRNAKGFTMVELLVVLVIVAILAAVATPLFIQNTKRAKATEAVATMGLMRQVLRDYKINSNYFSTSTIQDPLPPASQVNETTGKLKTTGYGLDIDVGIPQYFSNGAYTVLTNGTTPLTSKDGTSKKFIDPPPVDFIITVTGKTVANGGTNAECNSTVLVNCAIKASEVNDYIIEMDNSGRILVSYKDEGVDSSGNAIDRKWSNY